MLDTKSSVQLFRITVWTSDLVFFSDLTSDIGSTLRWILENNSSAQCFRVTVRTSDLKTTPVQNHFVSQLGLRIWIKTPVDLGKSFSAKSFRVTVRTSGLGKNSSSNSDRVTLRTSDLAKNQVRTKTVGS